jgi:mitochondrial chaperone BCS1
METVNSTLLLSNSSASTSNSTTATAAFDLTNLASLWASLATFSGLGPDWLKLVVLGGIVETFRRLLSTAWAKIVSGFWLSAEIDQSDKAYQWMMAWLSKQPAWSALAFFLGG